MRECVNCLCFGATTDKVGLEQQPRLSAKTSKSQRVCSLEPGSWRCLLRAIRPALVFATAAVSRRAGGMSALLSASHAIGRPPPGEVYRVVGRIGLPIRFGAVARQRSISAQLPD